MHETLRISEQKSTARFAIERRADGSLKLECFGRLRPGWCGNLTTGLATRRIAVVAGSASTDGDGRWRAQWILDDNLSSCDAQSLDFASLASHDIGFSMCLPLRLEGFKIFAGTRQLELDVSGPDEIGFLASLMKRLARLQLFPQRLELATNAGQIQDRLWLRGVGGAPATEEQARRLESHLLPLKQRSPTNGAP